MRAMETEARLSLRTAEERLSSVRGKAERLRRQAASERVAKARHEQAQMAKVAQRELAEVVAELAEDLHAKVNVSLARAEADRDDAEP
ncbi:hypothetical protein, partial [Klebsiella pneumoniae]|uniref:hypothetical protein n=1 Tax=Klebsiella pneumoniae TaxID=573 RepID=UPI00396A8E2D